MKLNHKQVADGDRVLCIHCDRESPDYKVKDASLTKGSAYAVESVCLGDNFIQIRNDKGQLDWYRTFKFMMVEKGNGQENPQKDELAGVLPKKEDRCN